MLSKIMNMGGYGAYVWAAYGVTLTVFAINLGKSILEKKKIEKMIKQYRNKIGEFK